MPLSVAIAINSLTAETVTVTRYPVGGYVDGIWQSGVPTQFQALCSVQQPTPAQLEYLPQGERDRDVRVFISRLPIYTTRDREGSQADEIEYKGSVYRLIDAADWDSYGYTRAMGAKL